MTDNETIPVAENETKSPKRNRLALLLEEWGIENMTGTGGVVITGIGPPADPQPTPADPKPAPKPTDDDHGTTKAN
jgi:hypothetical protein